MYDHRAARERRAQRLAISHVGDATRDARSREALGATSGAHHREHVPIQASQLFAEGATDVWNEVADQI